VVVVVVGVGVEVEVVVVVVVGVEVGVVVGVVVEVGVEVVVVVEVGVNINKEKENKMNIEEIMQKIVTGELNIRQALEQAQAVPMCNDGAHRISKYNGKNVFIRTVTHHYTGRVRGLSDNFITLVDVAWIADDGRFNEAIAKGEVEPYPDGLEVDIGMGAILDVCEWKHRLPRSVK
jgi:hypothetical protein